MENENTNYNSSEQENFEDIKSSSFEDIKSSSDMQQKFEDISSTSVFVEENNYKKKKRGPFAAIGRWWKRRKTWSKAVIISITSLFLIIALLIGTLFAFPNLFYNYDKNLTTDKNALGVEEIIDEKIINIALFGVDTRNPKSFTGNSDSIMILSLNTKTKKVKIISVMRDSLVPITYNDGSVSYKKINSAYGKSPEVAIRTLNKNFGLDITEYATVNFFGMVDIIDAVGGIDAELTEGEVSTEKDLLNHCIANICKQIGENPKKHYIYKAGKQHLNGIQAVAYSRIRKTANIWGTNNDYGRTDRQRYVMEQLFNKAVKIKKSQYMDLINALLPCSKTSLSPSEIYDLATSILLHSPKFEQTRMPLTEYLMTAPKTPAGSVVYYDLAFAKKIIHAFIYDDIKPEDYIKEHGVEKNDWFAQETGYTPPSKDDDDDDDDDDDKDPVTPDPDTPVTPDPENPDGDGDGGDDDGNQNPDGETPQNPNPEQ